jgi:hypothetical protein
VYLIAVVVLTVVMVQQVCNFEWGGTYMCVEHKGVNSTVTMVEKFLLQSFRMSNFSSPLGHMFGFCSYEFWSDVDSFLAQTFHY